MRNIAVVSARSGSKGLPDKNIRLFNGVPLLAYSVRAAKESGLFDTVFVSTDSAEYARTAKEWGAEVPFLRSEKTSGDESSSWDVVREALDGYRELGKEFDTAALLQPTSPLRRAQDIVRGYDLFEKKQANTVIGVCETDHSPLWCGVLPDSLSMDGFICQEVRNKSRQMLPVYYRINGALYIRSVKSLGNEDRLYEDRCFAFVMDRERSIDIDTEFDFRIAEFIAKTDKKYRLSC